VSRVEVTIDGVRVGNATLSGQRQGVAAVLGNDCLPSGWSLTVDIGSLDVGPHTVSAVAVDPGGNAVELGGARSITVTAASASGWTEYLYLGAQLLATIDGSSTNYHHADHLSVRVTRDTNGSVTSPK
jgi:hypothetical protein